ncbi:hypothetical protein TNCV_612251 [Trichonephila clavipes]|nr:hypothetical protein TNCV_612251 [Trichonephila clavipes]
MLEAALKIIFYQIVALFPKRLATRVLGVLWKTPKGKVEKGITPLSLLKIDSPLSPFYSCVSGHPKQKKQQSADLKVLTDRCLSKGCHGEWFLVTRSGKKVNRGDWLYLRDEARDGIYTSKRGIDQQLSRGIAGGYGNQGSENRMVGNDFGNRGSENRLSGRATQNYNERKTFAASAIEFCREEITCVIGKLEERRRLSDVTLGDRLRNFEPWSSDT